MAQAPTVAENESMRSIVAGRLTKEFGLPSRDVVKVKGWDVCGNVGLVLQVDQPVRENAAYLWMPYPAEGQTIPEIALEYPGEAGRHSGTYPAAGLKRGNPALKLTIRNFAELDEVVDYIRAMSAGTALPEVKARARPDRRSSLSGSVNGLSQKITDAGSVTTIDPSLMPQVEPVKPRREAIPLTIQREVWQRDGGQCVECLTRERLCFDHIVPFSKGGGNSVRNLQLLCEGCNLSKSNRI